MHDQVRSDIGFCRFVGCTIILDTAADRYFRTSEAMGEALEAALEGREIAPTMRDRLKALGLLSDVVSPAGPARTMPVQAIASAVEDSDDEAGGWVRALGAVTASQIWARILLASQPLSAVLTRVAALRYNARVRRRADTIEHAARIFHQCRGLLPWTPLCLPDTIAFIRFVTRRGHAPNLVIGVEAYPFAAHCWAQSGDIILNDVYDHATRFRPIFVI